MSLALIVVSLTLLANLLIASIVFINNKKSASNLLLTALTIVSAGWTLFTYLALFSPEPDVRLFWVRTVMFVTTPFGAIIYLLALAFPEKDLKIEKAPLASIIISNVITAVLAITPFTFSGLINLPGGNFELFPGPAIILFGINLIFFMTAGFVEIIKKFKKSRGLRRKQTGYFLIGLILTFSLATLTNFIAVVVFKTVSLTYIGPPLTLFFLGFVAWAIVRHKLLDIRVLVARAILYSSLLIALVGGYVLLIYTFFSIIPLGINRDVLFIAMAMVAAFSFNFIKTTLAKITDKLFFKDTYNTEELLSTLTHIMASEIHIKPLTTQLLKTLLDKMRVTAGAFIIAGTDGIKDIESFGVADESILNDKQFLKILNKHDEMIVFEDLEEGETKEFLRNKKISVILPLKVKDSKMGLFVLMPKASGESWESKDLEVLEIFAPEVAVALQNAESYLEIQEFNRTLEKKVEERTEELRKSHESELEKARQLLKLKDEFVFIATHDLKTPVTAIDGFVELIQRRKEKFSANTKSSFKAIVEASGRLKQLVNDLLEVARSDSGTIKVDVKPVNIVDLVKKVIKEVEPKAKAEKISITTKFDKSQMVLADEAKLSEVLENLISNAVKYNKKEGKIEVITIRNNSKLLTKVGDTGVGIPVSQQDKVFEKFFRAVQPGTENVTGTGLGLFVTRMLIEKMHGKISFESHEGKGTTFTFELPISQA
ncbi:MAG TPA: ATP-binding protein [Patescibacteria group bacterium]